MSASEPKPFISVQCTSSPCRTAYEYRKRFIIKLFSGNVRDCTGKVRQELWNELNKCTKNSVWQKILRWKYSYEPNFECDINSWHHKSVCGFKVYKASIKWTASSEFGTYRLCEQRRFRRACASAQSRKNLHCSLIQAVSPEEPSDRKPDPWPLWMAGHAQLKFVMTECSKTQIRLTGLKLLFSVSIVYHVFALTFNFDKTPLSIQISASMGIRDLSSSMWRKNATAMETLCLFTTMCICSPVEPHRAPFA